MAAVEVNRSTLVKKIAAQSRSGDAASRHEAPMSRRPRPPSGGVVGKPPSGNASKRSKIKSRKSSSEPRVYDFGLSVSSVDLAGNGEEGKKDLHVQFIMSDDSSVKETTYDLDADPLPDAEAVFITDLPHDPNFHGYYSDPLESAFNTLNEQISSVLSADLDTYSKSSEVQSVSQTSSENLLKPILKSRPHSASNPTHTKQKTRQRPKSASAAKDSRYLLVNHPRSDVTSGGDACEASDCPASPVIQMEPVVFSYNTGKQIGGFDYDDHAEPADQGEDSEQDSASETKKQTPGDLSVPSSIAHLLPWRVHEVPESITGMDTSNSLVLLPCCDVTRTGPKSDDAIRIVPPPQAASEELNFIEKLPAPRPLIKTKRPIESVKCSHGRKSEKIVTPRIKVYSNDGHVLHETHSGQREAEVVRKEIQELEDLMHGIGSFEGCLVVQLQAEINHINDTLGKMWPRLDEIRRREEAKSKEEEADTFGMRAFYQQHEDVMTQIRHQHRLCVLELSDIETDLEIDTSRAHFKNHQANIRPKKPL